MDAAFKSQLASIVGPGNVFVAAADMAGYLVEPRDLFHQSALAVVRPANTAEVAAVVAICAEAGVAIVPQGGNTGLVGGQVPATGREIILSLRRLDRLRDIDLASNVMIVEAGMTLARAQQVADEAGRLFPLSLASEGSCTIGGNLATNAGGTAALAYGTARDLVNGIEVVLADGRILSDLSKLKKDNTGYDLTHLFAGSEGTLGIITAAVLKLFPKPRSRATAFVGLATPRQALELLSLALQSAGGDVKTFELIPRIGLEFVLRHDNASRDPLATAHPWYILMEVASESADAEPKLLAILEAAAAGGALEDAAVAGSLEQRRAFWRIREFLPDAQKPEGGSIKHDISVPVASVPDFLASAEAAVRAYMPDARPVPFGHLGDGNIHWNLSQPVGADKRAFLEEWHTVNEIVHGVVARYHGSISAEHGIGLLKRDLLPAVKDPVALDVMRKLKQALDPKGILNPGKVL